jgi:ATP-dependent helicase YprA (DUF1998 family)
MRFQTPPAFDEITCYALGSSVPSRKQGLNNNFASASSFPRITSATMRKKKRYEPDHDHDSIGEDEKNHPRVLDALTEPELCEELRQKTRVVTGLTPRELQLRAAIALWRNRDLILHARTGSGKSLSFVMPCFLSKTVTVVIISPLNVLMDDQASLLYQFIFDIHQVMTCFRLVDFGNGDYRQLQLMQLLYKLMETCSG